MILVRERRRRDGQGFESASVGRLYNWLKRRKQGLYVRFGRDKGSLGF
jgi:hypothetical protein